MNQPTDPRIHTTIHDVLDPIGDRRHDVHLASGRWLRDGAAQGNRSRDLDGSAMWLLAGLYDADAHMPLLLTGVREYDLVAALWGGVQQMNVALPWQLLGGTPIADVRSETDAVVLPAITLVLSVSPTPDSEGFASWLAAHAAEVREALPGVCKLYTADPHFDRNLDAVWAAGLTPVVFSYAADDLERLLRVAHAPIHFRHAASGPMVAAMRAVTGAALQSSPHFLLPIPDGRRTELTVLPTPPDGTDRESLAAVVMAQIDVLASDHVSPAAATPAGPGLQTQQHFLQALLALVAERGWPLADVLAKATTAPADVFGVPLRDGFVVVDPTVPGTVGLFHKQAPDRAPYLGLDLPGRVVAIGGGDRAVML